MSQKHATTIHMTSATNSPKQSKAVVFTTVAPTLRPESEPTEPVDEFTQKVRDEVARATKSIETDWPSGQLVPTFIGERRPPIPAPNTATRVVEDANGIPKETATSYWPVFLDHDGTPTPAWTVLELVRSGEARIVDEDLDESVKIINWLRPAARGSFRESQEAIEAIGEEARQRMREMKALFDEAGITVFWEQDAPNGARRPKMRPVMLTAKEVADLFRVTPQTVYSWNGKRLPKAVSVGGNLLWRAKDIHTMLGRVA